VLLTFAADDWDERVDAVSRGLLGLTVSCARCHDHKFDPISVQDYYGLAGIFASTSAVARPLFDISIRKPRIASCGFSSTSTSSIIWRTCWRRSRVPSPRSPPQKVARFKAELRTLQVEVDALGKRYPELPKTIEKYVAIARVGSARRAPTTRRS